MRNMPPGTHTASLIRASSASEPAADVAVSTQAVEQAAHSIAGLEAPPQRLTRPRPANTCAELEAARPARPRHHRCEYLLEFQLRPALPTGSATEAQGATQFAEGCVRANSSA